MLVDCCLCNSSPVHITLSMAFKAGCPQVACALYECWAKVLRVLYSLVEPFADATSKQRHVASVSLFMG